MVYFNDRLTLDAPKHLKDGYLAVRAKAARTGTYQYSGTEVDPDNKHGLRDSAIVTVLRDENAVFDKGSVHSFIGKPITDSHPSVAVNSSNWKDHARGTIMGASWEEGGYLAFDLLLTDASSIAKVDGGKRELSNGYSAELEFGDFQAADGTKCQARQTKIFGNHVAIVDRGRAGSECAIKDVAVCDAITAELLDELKAITTKETPMTKITLDGLQVDLTDADAVSAAFAKLQDKATTAETALTDANAQVSTLTGEKTALEAKLVDAGKAIEPAALDKLVADRSALIAAAKAAKPDLVIDGKTDVDIRKEVVTALIGDAAADLDDAAIAGAFMVATRDAKSTDKTVQNIAPPQLLKDAKAQFEDVQVKQREDRRNAWKKQA